MFTSLRAGSLFRRRSTRTDGAKKTPPKLLIDRRNAPVQSKETVARMQKLIEEFTHAEVKIAVIAGITLDKMQAARMGLSNRRVFLDEATALEWLEGD